MQIVEDNDRSGAIRSSFLSAGSTRTQLALPPPHQPSKPQVLTDDLKAQLAAANQQRRDCLYPRLMQMLATGDQGGSGHSNYSEQRALSLQQLALANRARRSKLRESDVMSPVEDAMA